MMRRLSRTLARPSHDRLNTIEPTADGTDGGAIRIAIAEDAVGLRASCGSARERREAALQDVRPAAHAASHKIKARCLDLIRSIRVIRGWFDGLSSVAAGPRQAIRG